MTKGSALTNQRIEILVATPMFRGVEVVLSVQQRATARRGFNQQPPGIQRQSIAKFASPLAHLDSSSQWRKRTRLRQKPLLPCTTEEIRPTSCPHQNGPGQRFRFNFSDPIMGYGIKKATSHRRQNYLQFPSVPNEHELHE